MGAHRTYLTAQNGQTRPCIERRTGDVNGASRREVVLSSAFVGKVQRAFDELLSSVPLDGLAASIAATLTSEAESVTAIDVEYALSFLESIGAIRIPTPKVRELTHA